MQDLARDLTVDAKQIRKTLPVCCIEIALQIPSVSSICE